LGFAHFSSSSFTTSSCPVFEADLMGSPSTPAACLAHGCFPRFLTETRFPGIRRRMAQLTSLSFHTRVVGFQEHTEDAPESKDPRSKLRGIFQNNLRSN
jgi:hypothetical protein